MQEDEWSAWSRQHWGEARLAVAASRFPWFNLLTVMTLCAVGVVAAEIVAASTSAPPSALLVVVFAAGLLAAAVVMLRDRLLARHLDPVREAALALTGVRLTRQDATILLREGRVYADGVRFSARAAADGAIEFVVDIGRAGPTTEWPPG